tara:strand:+ start:687 stop:1133 length:447 start_codon:yes stop_codon:yes gene_type:complete
MAYRPRSPKVRKKYNLWHRYRITPEEHEKLVKANKGMCEVCNTRKGEAVDHCHATGEIRGYLCHACNRAIGLLGDTVEGLRQAVDYLEKERTHGIPIRDKDGKPRSSKALPKNDRGGSKPKVRRNVRSANRTRNKRDGQDSYARKAKQ